MASRRLGDDAVARVRRALEIYRRELAEVAQVYAEVAHAAHQPVGSGLPAALKQERTWADGCVAMIASNTDNLRYYAVTFPREYLEIMRSALVLLREDLAAARAQLGANRLAPAGHTAVLDRAIADLDADHDAFWGQWGASAYLAEIQRRRLLREGRVLLDAAGRAKLWCVCDANVFLQHTLFDAVKWPLELGTGALVLVVPTAVLRALDRYKSDPDKPRLRKRAQQVLPRLLAVTLSVPPSQPAPVRDGVELLLLDREPPIPEGLDPNMPDDRIIAAALDLGQRYVGATVSVLSADVGVQIKARSWGLGRVEIPKGLRLQRYAGSADE